MKLILTYWRRFWHCCKFMCSILSKATQPTDFIKPNVIQNLANRLKYISQINGGLIMFFSGIRE